MADESETGSRVILTGGARGIGHAVALQLAARGFPLVLGVRDIERGIAARRTILQTTPGASVDLLPLDLASLGSVREFAANYADRFGVWSSLILNAGAILVPHREITQDGFEMHLGVNHLGHFALTGLLLPVAAPGARVVTATSIAARMGRLQFHDLRWDHGYTPFRAYAASKRAGLVFARSLHRKSLEERLQVRSIATHPGYAVSPERLRSAGRFYERGFAHDYAAGAGPIVKAVTDPDLVGGEYIAPGGRFQTRGAPAAVEVPSFADDDLLSKRLWRISGQLTRIPW